MQLDELGYLSLSARHLQCLGLVAIGKSAADIGRHLGIPEDVITREIDEACRRLGTPTGIQAAYVARHAGLLGPQ